MFGIDPLYYIFALPALLFSMLASFLVKSTFSKFSRVSPSTGMSGAEAAARLLSHAGINDVSIEHIQGSLTDHYDPTAKVLRLSDSVYGSSSLSAVGVACHEAGHAIQHATAYAPLKMRTSLVPVVNFGSRFSIYFILVGALLAQSGSLGMTLVQIGIVLFAFSVLFALVTLPVEWDASARAKKLMVAAGIVSRGEASSAGKVLNAAFCTYLAAAASSIATLLYYLVRLGLIGGRSRD